VIIVTPTMKINKKVLGILSVGHLITDINQGALPVLLPFFKEALSLSYTMAGIILMFGNLTSSVIQPAFGYFSDKRPIGWLLPLAPVVACLGLSGTGLVPNYSLLLICVIVSGIGVASFHPEGFKTAHFFTGERKATGMSIFSVGGNFGLALGPMWALTLVTFFGLKGTVAMIIPGIIFAGVLALSTSWLTTPVYSAFLHTKEQAAPAVSRTEAVSLLLIAGIVTLRSFIQSGLMTYIPFYYINFLKGDPIYAGKLATAFLLAGAVGTLVGSPLADQWGHKRFLACTMILTFPLLLLFYNSGSWMSFVILAISGMVLISSFSVTVVMAQTLLPQRLGMASGLTAGFSVGTGGIGVTFLGMIADRWGVPTAMKSILIFPLIGFGLSMLLKYPPEKEKTLSDK